MEEAERSHHQLLLLHQQVAVFSRIQVHDSPWRPPGKPFTSVQAREVPELLCGALVARGDELVDGDGEEQLRVGQLQAPPEETPQPQGPVNINRSSAGTGATLQAQRAQQPGKPKEVVAVEVSDENLGDSGCRFDRKRQNREKTGKQTM